MITQTVALTGASSGDIDVESLIGPVDAPYDVVVRVLPGAATNTLVAIAGSSFTWNESDATTGDWVTLTGPGTGANTGQFSELRVRLQEGDSLYAGVLGALSATASVTIFGNPAC